MPNSFEVPEDDSPPSTPDRFGQRSSNLFHFGEEPSTTPAGPPPPSSAASFTPAGAPSASYLGSSMMRGATAQKPVSFNSRLSGNSSKKLLPSKTNSPLGRSVKGSKGRQPSRLSRQFVADEDEEEEEEGDEGADSGPRTFEVRYEESDADGAYESDEQEQGDDAMEDDAREQSPTDFFLGMGQTGSASRPAFGDESDLMMLATPAVDDRIRREAEDIFRASAMRSSGRPAREFKYAGIAKSLYTNIDYADITEAPQVVIESEALVSRLYHDGVGPEDDADRLDKVLAETSAALAGLWNAYVDSLPSSDEEHAAGIGPGPHAPPFESAAYLANLVLQVHHTRYGEAGDEKLAPLTETMFEWLRNHHNLYRGQIQDVQKHKAGAASHRMFWPTVFIALLQGNVVDALRLLNAGGWEKVRHGGQLAYTGRALSNVQRAIQETSDMLENCPGKYDNWEIWASEWTLFRIRAKGSLDQLRRFAEGHGLGESDFGESLRSRNSMAGRARKAESQVPWDIYENLNIIFDIALGSRDRILAISQDWCEATVGLFGWWDEGGSEKSMQLSRSRGLILADQTSAADSYLDRLARSFQTVVGSGLEIDSNRPLEIGMACVFEDNSKGVIGILRTWSLPVASAVAEIASLGGWLSQHQPGSGAMMEGLDMEDLDVLGIDPSSPDEIDGIKDNTLVQYAQALVNCNHLSHIEEESGKDTEAWELAIHVLGRMDSSERSEETVGEIVKTILDRIDADSGGRVDKVWRLLNDLGMIAFAEETAEHYGDVLAQKSHRYGEAMWQYALAHRPNKVREVMNLLISHSLIQSTAYPPEDELDDHLQKLLVERNMMLEEFAKQDLEAAGLLGKMLSGYATLRKFYDMRDDETVALPRRRAAAAAALTAVIASADDNIRGGLYDGTRDAIVSEDFLLALLGEALVFVNASPKPSVSLEAIDTLLKAVEDIQTVGPRVYTTCNDFFQLVLKSAPGLKGSTPADLMRKSTSSLSGMSSFVMSGSSMLASQLHRSGMMGKANIQRGWDWRSGLTANTTAEDVLGMMRLGLTKDLARLWVAEADGSLF